MIWQYRNWRQTELAFTSWKFEKYPWKFENLCCRELEKRKDGIASFKMISGVFWKLAGKKLTLTTIVAETGPLRQTHNSHIAAGEAKEGLDYLFIAAHKISINVSSSFDQNRIISLFTQLHKEFSNCLWKMCLLPNINWKHEESGKSRKNPSWRQFLNFHENQWSPSQLCSVLINGSMKGTPSKLLVMNMIILCLGPTQKNTELFILWELL